MAARDHSRANGASGRAGRRIAGIRHTGAVPRFREDPALRPPPWQPLTFKGHLATAAIHQDRVEIRRSRLGKLGGNKDAAVTLADVVGILSKEPTPLVNGYVFLATDADPARLRGFAARPAGQIAGNPHTVMFTWGQWKSFAAFLESADATWRANRGRGRRPVTGSPGRVREQVEER